MIKIKNKTVLGNNGNEQRCELSQIGRQDIVRQLRHFYNQSKRASPRNSAGVSTDQQGKQLKIWRTQGRNPEARVKGHREVPNDTHKGNGNSTRS